MHLGAGSRPFLTLFGSLITSSKRLVNPSMKASDLLGILADRLGEILCSLETPAVHCRVVRMYSISNIFHQQITIVSSSTGNLPNNSLQFATLEIESKTKATAPVAFPFMEANPSTRSYRNSLTCRLTVATNSNRWTSLHLSPLDHRSYTP